MKGISHGISISFQFYIQVHDVLFVNKTDCENYLYWVRYILFNLVCPFHYTAVAGSGKVGPVNQVNHTS